MKGLINRVNYMVSVNEVPQVLPSFLVFLPFPLLWWFHTQLVHKLPDGQIRNSETFDYKWVVVLCLEKEKSHFYHAKSDPV